MPVSAESPGQEATSLMLLVVALPFLAAALMPVARGLGVEARNFVNIAAAGALFTLALLLALLTQLAEPAVTLRTLEVPGAAPLPLTLAIDDAAGIALVVVVLVEVAIAFFSTGYVPEGRHVSGYFALLWLAIGTLNASLVAGDLVTLFAVAVFASLALMLLVALDFSDEGAAAGMKLFVMIGLAAVMGLAVAWYAFALTPDLRLAALAANPGPLTSDSAPAVLGLLLVALVAWSGLAPLHTWVTSAGSVTLPTIGAMIAAVALTVFGFHLVRLVAQVFPYGPGWLGFVATLGAVSVGFGTIGALRAADVLDGLPFAAVAQVGFAAVALGADTPLAPSIAVFQLLHAALALGLLYLAVGASRSPGGELRFFDAWRTQPAAAQSQALISGLALLVGGIAVAALPATTGNLARALLAAALLAEGGLLPLLWLVIALLGTAGLFWFVLRFLWQPVPEGAPEGGETAVRGGPGPSGRPASRVVTLRRSSMRLRLGVVAPLGALVTFSVLLGIDSSAVWRLIVAAMAGPAGALGTTAPELALPANSAYLLLVGHLLLLLMYGLAVLLRAIELRRAPVEVQRQAALVAKRAGPVDRLGKRVLRAAEAGWLDPYNLVWAALLGLGHASALILDNTLGRLGRTS